VLADLEIDDPEPAVLVAEHAIYGAAHQPILNAARNGPLGMFFLSRLKYPAAPFAFESFPEGTQHARRSLRLFSSRHSEPQQFAFHDCSQMARRKLRPVSLQQFMNYRSYMAACIAGPFESGLTGRSGGVPE